MDLQAMNQSVIEEFRQNGGKVGDRFEGMPLLLINTIGAKSGKTHTKPLAYLKDGERFIVIASFAGAANNPPWLHNVIANPELDVEVGAETFRATASVVDEPERTALFEKMAKQMPVFADYQSKTDRVIPVVALTRI